MSSPYTSSGHPLELADEDPTLLTIRRAEPADATVDGASRSLFGTNASRYGIGSTRGHMLSSGTALSGKKLSSGNFVSRPYIERSRFENSAATADRTGSQSAEDVGIRADVEKAGSKFGTRSYGGGCGAVRKLRTPHRRSIKKPPYERPGTGRHTTAGESSGMERLPASSSSRNHTIASRLRDSASRFIEASTAYLFPGLFKRQPFSIQANGESQGVVVPVEQETSEEMPDSPTKQNVPAMVDVRVKPVESECSELDIGQVEEILKQKTLSREQVNRLTRILQKHVSNIDDGTIAVEAEKSKEQTVVDTKDSSPIQVARAYMGEQGARPSSAGLATTVHAPGFLLNQVEDPYPSSPFSRGWAGGSVSVRMPKRSLRIDDDIALMGPVRRVRQKTSMLTSSSPHLYSRRMSGLRKPSETWIPSPPSQSSQTAMKILETLEKLSPSPQGKLLGTMTEKLGNVLQGSDKFSPPSKGKISSDIFSLATSDAHMSETIRAREKSVIQNSSLFTIPKEAETKINGKVTSEEVEVKKPSVSPSSVTQTCNFSMQHKGFRMNAVFEETHSDEETKLQAKPHTSIVASDQASLLKEETILSPGSSAVSFSKTDIFPPLMVSSPEPVQVSSSSSAARILVGKPSSPTTAPHIASVSQELTKFVSSVPSFSSPAVTMEMRPTVSLAAIPSAASVSFLEKEGLTLSSITAVQPAIPSVCDRFTEASKVTIVSMPVTPSSGASESTVTSVQVSSSMGFVSSGSAATDASRVSLPVLMKPISHIDPSVAENVVKLASGSPMVENQAEGDTMATDFTSEEADDLVGTVSSLPVSKLFDASPQPSTSTPSLFAAGSSGTMVSAPAFSVGFASGTSSAGASASSLSSPFSFVGQSGTAFGPTSFSGASVSLSSATAFAFGGQSNTSSTRPTPAFAAGASISSAPASFAFGAQSFTVPGQESTSASKPMFGESLTISSGHTPFGALSSSLANPFQSSAASSSPYIFSSSNAAIPGQSSASCSMASVFTSSSPVTLSFGGTQSPFQLGSPAMPSSLMSGPVISSAMSTPFTMPSLPTSVVPSMSATPTFAFSAAAGSTCGASSGSSAVQSLAFGATQMDPFSSSGTQSTSFKFGAVSSPFSSASSSSTSLFGLSASTSIPNAFSFGSASLSAPSPFTFGSGQPLVAQATAPQTFTFGDQPGGALPVNGQPFGFTGGQPVSANPSPNPFSAATTAQPGLGFALGATGGDKSGRKYIKAKRIGTKKGK